MAAGSVGLGHCGPAQASVADGALAASVAATYVVTARAHPRIEAPADEYFGTYRLSTLSVRNAIYDMTVEGDSPLALPLQRERIAAVRSALVAWAEKYPLDPWLPSAMVKFSNFLIAKAQPEYDVSAQAFLSYLAFGNSKTWYARFATAKLSGLEIRPNIDMLALPEFVSPAGLLELFPLTLRVRRHR